MVLHGISSTLRPEHPAMNNNKMFNNIIYKSKAADLVIYANQSVAINNFSDYNLYFSPGGDVKIAWTSIPSYRSNYRNLEKFSTFSGLESHSQWADPKFANISAGDYTLEKISPAIGAGTTAVRELGDQDLAGNQRVIKGSIDLGAYEYQGER